MNERARTPTSDSTNRVCIAPPTTLETCFSEAGTLKTARLLSAEVKQGSNSYQKYVKRYREWLARVVVMVRVDRFLTYHASKTAKLQAATPKHWILWAPPMTTAPKDSSLRIEGGGKRLALMLGSRSVGNNPSVSVISMREPNGNGCPSANKREKVDSCPSCSV